MNANTHLHLCLPINREKESSAHIRARLARLQLELKKYTDGALPACVLRLNVLYFGLYRSSSSAQWTAVSGSEVVVAPTESAGVSAEDSSYRATFAAKSLLNLNLQLSDLEHCDASVYDHISKNWYGSVFGTEDNLRDKIRSFVSANADQRKVVVLDQADLLSISLQSELREYTGRSADKVQFVLLSYPSWSNDSDLQSTPLVFLESLQSRLATTVFRPAEDADSETRAEWEDSDFRELRALYLASELSHLV